MPRLKANFISADDLIASKLATPDGLNAAFTQRDATTSQTFSDTLGAGQNTLSVNIGSRAGSHRLTGYTIALLAVGLRRWGRL